MNLKTLSILLGLLFMLYIPIGLTAQENSASEVHYIESVKLVTDRTIYLAGEELFYSAYVFCNNNSLQTCLSQVLYVEMYRSLNSNSIKQKLKIKDGAASGSIKIPADFATGTYFIRAYTNYQKNYLPQELTYSEIQVLNPEVPIKSAGMSEPYTLYFEGGKAIAGILNDAVLVFDQQQANPRGAYLLNGNRAVIDSAQFLESHLASLEFTPQPNRSYYLQIIPQRGEPVNYPLELPWSNGWKISADTLGKMLHVSVSSSPKTVLPEAQILICNEYRQAFPPIPLASLSNGIEKYISLDNFDAKTLFIQLQESNGSILAFDIMPFAPHTEKLSFETGKHVFHPGEKIEIRLPNNTAADLAWLTAAASIEGSNSLQKNSPAISEALTIVQEHLYFNNKELQQQLVNQLILPPVPKLPDIRDVSVSGRVVNGQSSVGIAHCKVYLSVLGNQPQFHITKTDSLGNFVFSLDNFTGIQKIYAGIDYVKQGNANILVNTDFLPRYIPPFQFSQFDSTQHSLYEKLFINKQVADYFNTKQESKSIKAQFATQALFTQPDFSVKLEDYIAMKSMEEIFVEVVPYTYLRQKHNSFYLQMKNPVTEVITENPLVMLDNIPIFDLNAIMNLPPENIERVDLISHKYFVGKNSFNGIIQLVSKSIQLEKINFPSGTVFFDYQTNNPLIESVEQTDSISDVPHLENTVYWNESVNLNKRPVQFNFFAPSKPGAYQVTIHGITKEGKPGLGVYNFTVKL